MASSRTPAGAHEIVLSDAVHSDVTLTPLEAALISSREFQRLRRVRQLGFAHLVYPSATHTRFDHSIGTCWMSKEICAYLTGEHPRSKRKAPPDSILRLENRYTEIRGRVENRIAPSGEPERITVRQAWQQVISAAALLHDVTHIPFGHSLEDELDAFVRHDALESPRLYRILYESESELASVFEEPESWIPGLDNGTLRQLIYLTLRYTEKFEFEQGFASPRAITGYRGFRELLDRAMKVKAPESEAAITETSRAYKRHFEDSDATGLFMPFMADIVGNTICADLLDYLRRDSLFCGLDERVHPRLLRALDVAEESGHSGAPRVFVRLLDGRGGMRSDVISDLQKLLTLRYNLAAKVYYHPVKAAATRMLLKAIELAKDPELQPFTKSEPFDEEYFLKPTASDDLVIHDLMRLFTRVRRGDVPPSARRKAEIGYSLAMSLSERRLFKRLYSGRIEDGGDEEAVYAVISKYHQGSSSQPAQLARDNLEVHLAKRLTGGMPAGQVEKWAHGHAILCYCPARKMQAKLATVRVGYGDKIVPLIQKPGLLNEYLQILHRQYHELWHVYLFVHPEVIDGAGLDKGRIAQLNTDAETEFNLENEYRARFGLPAITGGREKEVKFDPASDCLTLMTGAQRDLDLTEELINKTIVQLVQNPSRVVEFWPKAAKGATLDSFHRQPSSVRLSAYKALADAITRQLIA